MTCTLDVYTASPEELAKVIGKDKAEKVRASLLPASPTSQLANGPLATYDSATEVPGCRCRGGAIAELR